jgi:hypothetical protein
MFPICTCFIISTKVIIYSLFNGEIVDMIE